MIHRAGLQTKHDATLALCGRPPTIPEGDFYPSPGLPPLVATPGSHPHSDSILKGLSTAPSARSASVHDIDAGGALPRLAGEWRHCHAVRGCVEHIDGAGHVLLGLFRPSLMDEPRLGARTQGRRVAAALGYLRVFLFARLRRRPRGPSPGLWPPSPRGKGIRWESIHGGCSSPLSRACRLAKRAQLRRGGGAGVGEYQVVVPLRHRSPPLDRSCSSQMSCPSDSKPHTNIKSDTISTT